MWVPEDEEIDHVLSHWAGQYPSYKTWQKLHPLQGRAYFLAGIRQKEHATYDYGGNESPKAGFTKTKTSKAFAMMHQWYYDRSAISWLNNALGESSGGSVMYSREKVSLCRHTFSCFVHISRSLLSNDTPKAPQWKLLCQSGSFTAVPLTTSLADLHLNKKISLYMRYAKFSCSGVATHFICIIIICISMCYISLHRLYQSKFRYMLSCFLQFQL